MAKQQHIIDSKSKLYIYTRIKIFQIPAGRVQIHQSKSFLYELIMQMRNKYPNDRNEEKEIILLYTIILFFLDLC